MKTVFMAVQHLYKTTVTWTGNKGTGTSDYREYERSHTISIDHKPQILGSSDIAFRGDQTKHNPEDMLVSALSTCHMLWYLHLCADAGVVVVAYTDTATGLMVERPGGGGKFTEVILNPVVTVKENSMIEKANELHQRAHECCFIASSVNFPVRHKPIAILLDQL